MKIVFGYSEANMTIKQESWRTAWKQALGQNLWLWHFSMICAQMVSSSKATWALGTGLLPWGRPGRLGRGNVKDRPKPWQQSSTNEPVGKATSWWLCFFNQTGFMAHGSCSFSYPEPLEARRGCPARQEPRGRRNVLSMQIDLGTRQNSC